MPVRPRVLNELTVGQEGQAPYVPVDTGPRPLAVRAPEPMLAHSAPRVDPQIEEIEKRLGANHEGFQDAILKQMQSLTYQLALVIRSQQPGPPPQVESGRHATGMWCIQCKQPGHTSQYCQNRPNQTNKTTEGHNNRIRGRRGKTSMVKVTIGVLHLGRTSIMKVRKIFIIHMVGGMLRVNVGRMVRIAVVTTVEVVTPRRNVGNRIAVVMG